MCVELKAYGVRDAVFSESLLGAISFVDGGACCPLLVALSNRYRVAIGLQMPWQPISHLTATTNLPPSGVFQLSATALYLLPRTAMFHQCNAGCNPRLTYRYDDPAMTPLLYYVWLKRSLICPCMTTTSYRPMLNAAIL